MEFVAGNEISNVQLTGDRQCFQPHIEGAIAIDECDPHPIPVLVFVALSDHVNGLHFALFHLNYFPNYFSDCYALKSASGEPSVLRDRTLRTACQAQNATNSALTETARRCPSVQVVELDGHPPIRTATPDILSRLGHIQQVPRRNSRQPTLKWGAIGLAVAAEACSALPRQPPGKPPTPRSVTVASPGGDANDPHEASLARLLTESWGSGYDKDEQLYVPLPDGARWRRVRFFGVEHFLGFRYGDEHHVVSVVSLLDAPDEPKPTSETCMQRFEAWARPQTRGYDVALGPISETHITWRGTPILVHTLDGHIDLAFSRRKFSAAWASYAVYPKTCLIYAMAAPWGKSEALAKRVRQRWVKEAFSQVNPVTTERPYRK